MSSHHDQRGGDRYAPPPRIRDPPLSASRPPPSGPSRQFSGLPPSSSAGPPRHPSVGYSRSYDSAPRGPRSHDSGPPYPRHEAPPRRPSLSLWSTQNPGGRDGYHHSGQPPSQSRPYPPPSSYRDYDRDPYDRDRDRDYRGPPRDRYRDGPPPPRDSRDSYPPPGSYRDQPRHPPPYHSNYQASPSPPTGPRHGYSSYPPPRPPPSQSEVRSRERTPSGPSAWSSSRNSISDKRYPPELSRPRDRSPSISAPFKPRSPPPAPRLDENRRSSFHEQEPFQKTTAEDERILTTKPSSESLASVETKDTTVAPISEKMEDVKTSLEDTPEKEGDEDLLTQDDVDRRIRAIDEELESTEQRIADIDLERQEHERQLQILHLREKMENTLPPVPELRPEVATEEETEEDVEMVETPADIDEKSPVSIPKQEPKLPIVRKRPRPLSITEIEEEPENRENLRVRIWKQMKDVPIKEEPLEILVPSTISTEALRIIEKVEDMSDYETEQALHQAQRHKMFRTLLIRKKRQEYRQEKLRLKYRQRYRLWQVHMDKLDSQRREEMERLGISQSKPEPPSTPRTETAPPGTPGTELVTPDPLTRGTRRAQQAAHARDYVQSEAEFLELMQSLSSEDKDPTAKIPPMLPPDERDLIDFDDTGFIADPVEFYRRALFSVQEGSKFDVNGWSQEEDRIYLRRLAIAGKQFGRFRRAPQLAHRSVQELVQHYYFLKGDGEGLDWRNVIAGKNRYGRGSAASQSNAPSVLIGSGAPTGRPRGGRGRGKGRGPATIPLLQSKSQDDETPAPEDDADDSGSVTHERIRAARGKKGKTIESTAAKQRPKRSTVPLPPKEKIISDIAPSPAPSIMEDTPIGLERGILPTTAALPPSISQADLALSTDRDSSVPPTEGKKRVKGQFTSSYWRVNEMEMFPRLLQTYGRNWVRIAEGLGSKTPQMVKNYYSKHAAALGYEKMADEAESLRSRPQTAPIPPKIDVPVHEPSRSPGWLESSTIRPSSLLEPIHVPPEPARPPPKGLPTVASLLNSPPIETARPDRTWSEPLAPSPLPLPSTLHLDLQQEANRLRSSSNASDSSRSQSRSEMYSRDMGRQSSIYNQAPIPHLNEDRFYREEGRPPSVPPPPTRYIPSPQQSLLPPPSRLPESLGRQSPLYSQPPPHRYESGMPPPPLINEPHYMREIYSRSPVQIRPPVGSPLPPPTLPTHAMPGDNRSMYYYSAERERRQPPPEIPRDPRYPPFREEPYYEVPEYREYARQDDDRFIRGRGLPQRERPSLRHLIDDRERDRSLADREREIWRERYPDHYSRQYPPPRPRSPDRFMHNRDNEPEEWSRMLEREGYGRSDPARRSMR